MANRKITQYSDLAGAQTSTMVMQIVNPAAGATDAGNRKSTLNDLFADLAQNTTDKGTSWTGVATASAPAVSAAGKAKIYYDTTLTSLMISVAGGAYSPISTGLQANIPTSTYAALPAAPTRTLLYSLTDNNRDLYYYNQQAARWVAANGFVFNIHDFGASPSASAAVNTAAIQAAFVAATAASLSYPTAAGLYAGSMPVVYFPQAFAVYETSSSIDLTGNYVQVEGNNCVLKKAASFAGSYAMERTANAWQMTFNNLQFDGYPGGVYLDSSNLDVGTILFYNCSFYDISGDAIHLDAQSSLSVIERCRFSTVTHSLYVETGDKVMFRDCWIFPSVFSTNYDAAIINYGTALHIQGGVFVPAPQTVTEPAWVNNYGCVYIEDTRFGGEPGAMSGVNNFCVADTSYPQNVNGVQIRACPEYSNNPAGTPLVRLFEIPNTIILENNFGLLETPLISWSASVSGGSQTTKIAAAAAFLLLRTEGNAFSSATPAIPTNLQPYLMQPVAGTGVTVTPDATGKGSPSIAIGQSVSVSASPVFVGATFTGSTSLTWNSGVPTTAVMVSGASGTGAASFFNTPSLNSAFSSGLGIDGSFAAQISTVRLGSYGVKSAGGYGSRLALGTTLNTTYTDWVILDQNGLLSSSSHVITSASATALAVGANGATNPVLQIDGSTASVATGIKITGRAASSGVEIAAISSGANEDLYLTPKGSGAVFISLAGDQYKQVWENGTVTSALWVGSTESSIGTTSAHNFHFFTNNIDQLFLTTAGNLGLGTATFGTSAAKAFGLFNGTAPSTSPADTVQLYAFDITAGQSALHIRDEGGSVYKIGGGALSLPDAANISVGTATGTKIGTATTEKLGFWNATPVVRPAAYTVTNLTTDRVLDANATTLDELADVVGTLITDLKSIGLIG